MKYLYYLLCLMQLTSFSQLGQKEPAQWYFGFKAGLNFQNGAPVTISTSDLSTQFSSSGISDSLGNLLFYVRGGDIIYNKNNTTMANGTNIGGHSIGSQASLVIRKSGSKYYVITHNGGNYSQPSPIPPMTQYSIVDMSLAAGMGSVTVSNMPISPTGTPMVSKLAATRHCNKEDHWVLTHQGGNPGSNRYYAYLVTNAGISANPVVTAIGSIQPQGYGFYRGLHKFSPNGKKVCATLPYRTVELYDFDNSTGMLSNVIKLDSLSSPTNSYNPTDPAALGIEFSPDGSKLYVSYAANHPFLCQFNLCAGSPYAIAASKTVINSYTIANDGNWYYDLQLAPDGKIYSVFSSSVNSLGIINNPNGLGALCNYSPQALPLGTIVSSPFIAMPGAGLPQFISSFFEQRPVLGPITTSIVCGSVNYAAPVLCGATGYSVIGYQWNFGDPVSGMNTSASPNPTHVFSANGTYNIKLVLQYHPCGADTLKQTVNITGLPVFTVSGKTTICKGELTTLTFNGASTYSINGVALAQSSAQIQPTLNTTYTVIAKDNGSGCSSLKTVSITVLPCIGIDETNTSYFDRLLVYPNPNAGIFSIQLIEPSLVRVIDISGKEIYRESLLSGSNEIGFGNLKNGLYFLEVNNVSGSKTYKLIKE